MTIIPHEKSNIKLSIEPEVNLELAIEHGLSEEEYKKIIDDLDEGRRNWR